MKIKNTVFSLAGTMFTQTIVLGLALVFALGVNYLFAWTGPTQSPPEGNTPPPINISSTDQTKVGDLILQPGGLTAMAIVSHGDVLLDRNSANYSTTGLTLEGSRSNASAAFSSLTLKNYNASKLQTYDAVRIAGHLRGTGNAGELRFYTADNGILAANPAMLIESTGNVGIGTNDPTSKLTVNGDIEIDGTQGTTGIVFPNGDKQTVAYIPGQEPLVLPHIEKFECWMEASNHGCTGIAYCPVGSTVSGLKAFSTNIAGFVQASEFSAAQWNRLTFKAGGNGFSVVAPVSAGMSSVNYSNPDTDDWWVNKNTLIRDLSQTDSKGKSIIGDTGVRYRCRANEGSGGDCHIYGELTCN